MKKILILALMIFTAIVVSGCKDKGEAFIGTWSQVTEDKYPSSIVINYDDGVYHVDVKHLNEKLVDKKKANAFMDYMTGKSKERPSASMDLSDCYSVSSFESQALNDTTLKSDGFSMRIENGTLKYNGDSFVRK